MREIVGQSNIQPILTGSAPEDRAGRAEADAGDARQLRRRHPASTRCSCRRSTRPAQVIDAFRDVQAARADKERLQNEAFAYANHVVPEARGEAERILQGADGYKEQTVAEAHRPDGALPARSTSEYKKAPEVTRKRMYLETMERVLGGTDKIILDSKGGQGVVPFLPLDQLQNRTQPRREPTDACALSSPSLVMLVGARCRGVYSRPFIVHQNEQALVLRFGKPKRVVTEPGLNWKIPLVETVDIFDKRILDLDTRSRRRSPPPTRSVSSSMPSRATASSIRCSSIRRVRDERQRALAPRADHRIRRCAACSARSTLPGRRARQARGADEAHRPAGEQGGQGVRPRGRRRAHQARRPARAELQERVRPHARRAPARGGRVPRRGRRRGQPHPATADREVTVIKAEATRKGERTARRAATPSATASSPRRSAAIPTSSASTARCRPTSRASSRATRACCCRPTASSSSTSPIRTGNRQRRRANRSNERSRRRDRSRAGDRGPAVGRRAAAGPASCSRRRRTMPEHTLRTAGCGRGRGRVRASSG